MGLILDRENESRRLELILDRQVVYPLFEKSPRNKLLFLCFKVLVVQVDDTNLRIFGFDGRKIGQRDKR